MKSAIVDFGNVVALFDHRRAARQIAALSSAGLSEADVYDEIFASGLESDFDIGALAPSEFIKELRQRFSLQATDQAISVAWSTIFSSNPETAEMLPALRRAIGRLVLASNTNELHFRQITEQFPRELSLFDELVLSFRVGTRKPDAKFFERCIEAARARAEDCIYVDDRADFVASARRLGLNGILYTPGEGLDASLWSS